MKDTDRELLEWAAKAAGIEVTRGSGFQSDMLFRRVEKPSSPLVAWVHWNPLDDDGDALRLAVALDMNVFQAAKSAYALPSDDDGTYEMQVRYADERGNKDAATRRAIVRAAAEIGKGMA